MEHNHTVILDLSNCKDLYELHQQIKIAFDFPDYYGENWDAFFDLLCTDSDAAIILIRGIRNAPQSLSEHLEKLYDTINAAGSHLSQFNTTLIFEIID